MSLSESERNIIVNRELEKSQWTFEDVLFCAREGKWETAAMWDLHDDIIFLPKSLYNKKKFVSLHRNAQQFLELQCKN